jgi:mono/diheme cytochrome c family protein
MKKILKWTAILLGGLVVLTFLAGLVMYPIGLNKLQHSYSAIQIEALPVPTDAAAVDRGKHVAGMRACSKCHGDNLGGKLLSGDAFIGTLPAANLTAGEGGIGASYTDTDWVRAIRHGVKPDGRAAVFMNDYSTLSDQDLGDLIAYLKQIPPVDSQFPAAQYGPLIPVVFGSGLYPPAAEKMDHGAPRPADPAPGATREYGQYLSAICSECHGKSLAGKLEQWNQQDFIGAVQTGVRPDGQPLSKAHPQKAFAEMNDTELTALWLYFQSVRSQAAQK